LVSLACAARLRAYRENIKYLELEMQTHHSYEEWVELRREWKQSTKGSERCFSLMLTLCGTGSGLLLGVVIVQVVF